MWELEVPLSGSTIETEEDVKELIEGFHKVHEEVFAIRDSGSQIEIVGWSANVSCRIRKQEGATLAHSSAKTIANPVRKAYFAGKGFLDSAVLRFEAMQPGEPVSGPAIVESSFTTVVINPGSIAERRPSGSLSIIPGRD